ncbi:hypothetical protein [Streptomyces sp. NPDC059883]|uniref:hypothetical protein n=1 Tax=unclassified Streptomyces TaxID=2593676 RepID=UPI00365E3C16
MIALNAGLAVAVLLLGTAVAVMALLLREGRYARRAEASAAERAARPAPLSEPFTFWSEPWASWCRERGFLTRGAWHNRPCDLYDPSKEPSR